MSTVIAKNIQIGADTTATNNFTVYQPATPNGTLLIGNGNTGITSSLVALTSAGEFLVGGTTSLTNDRPAMSVSSNFGAPHINMLRDDSTVVASNPLGEIRWFSNDSTSNTPVLCAKIESQADGDHGAGDNPTNLIFYTTPDNSTTLTERMRLNSSGNLGLGVTPSVFSGLTAGRLEIGAAGNSLFSNGSTNFWLTTNTNYETGTGYKYATTGVATMYLQSAGQHQWHRAASGTAGNAISFTQAMTLDASGNLLVGTTSFSFTTNETAFGYSPGNGEGIFKHNSGGASGDRFIGFHYSTSRIGSITQNGTTAVAYNTSSDYRLKNITGPITTSGAYIDSLNPVEGTWKTDGSTFVGLLAHEAQEVSRTQVATGEKDGEEMQSMSYSSSEMIANMIAELKALRARIAALEAA